MSQPRQHSHELVLGHHVVLRVALVLNAQVVGQAAVAVEAVPRVRQHGEGLRELDLHIHIYYIPYHLVHVYIVVEQYIIL